MRTLVEHLQKYYGVYLLIIAVLFLVLWFPNRAVNRYAISRNARDGGVLIIDTRTGQDWHYDLVKKYADQYREALQKGDTNAIEKKIDADVEAGKLDLLEDGQKILDRAYTDKK